MNYSGRAKSNSLMAGIAALIFGLSLSYIVLDRAFADGHNFLTDKRLNLLVGFSPADGQWRRTVGDPEAYLRAVIARIADRSITINRLDELLPWNIELPGA